MITAGFHTRNDDWMLVHKLRVLSQFCDRVVVIADRSPQSESICRKFPKVEAIPWRPTHDIPQRNDGGSIMCEEGLMRQAAWDAATKDGPEYVILGDTDEVPTPDIVGWLELKEQPAVDVFYVDSVNLYASAYSVITGPCIYSYQRNDNNKRSVICRWRPGREYRYDVGKFAHVMLDPNPTNPGRWSEDATHKWILAPKCVHYKFADWDRWMAGTQRLSPKYQGYLHNVATSPMPRPWLWRWSADEWLRDLPEPIAVVGNGMIVEKGPEIDGHPTVIRFNNFATDGFSEHVGSKTTAWCTNCWGDVKRRQWHGELFTTNSDGHYDEQVGQWLGTHPHMRIADSDWIGACSAELGVRRPSTGLTLLHRLATMGKSVDAYGFGGLIEGGHYWKPEYVHGHGDSVGTPGDERPMLAQLASRINFHG